MHVDPYAPPKTTLRGTGGTTYLDQDGYVFHSELVANQHFKSPLICAKLGIPLPPEPQPIREKITIKRIPRTPKFATPIISFFSFCLLCAFIFYLNFNFAAPIILGYIILATLLKRITSIPYQIPFYFSQEYIQIRARRKLIFGIISLVLLVILITGYFTSNDEFLLFSIPAIIITFIIYKFKTTLFIVSDTKGEFHYIRGVHPKLLEAIPYLPLS